MQAAKTPTRDMLGVSLLFRYYNLLYYVERRFFPSDRSLGVYFEWYDSLTGKWSEGYLGRPSPRPRGPF